MTVSLLRRFEVAVAFLMWSKGLPRYFDGNVISTLPTGQIMHRREKTNRGRPPLPAESARSERIVTFLNPKERNQLDALAAASGKSISAQAHDLIAEAMSASQNENDQEG